MSRASTWFFAALLLCPLLVGSGAAFGARVEYGAGKFFGDTGRGRDELERPAGMAFSSRDVLAVAETKRNTISFYDKRGNWQNSVGQPFGDGAVQLKGPMAVAYDEAGRLWVADTGNDRIVQLNQNGLVLKAFGSTGAMKGGFRRPVDVSYGRGRVFVADAGNKRVQVFAQSGEWLETWDQWSVGGGAVRVPSAIAWSDEDDGSLWVANEGSTKLCRVDMSGRTVEEIELSNMVEGGVKIVDLFCDGDFKRLFICDGESNRVLVVSGRKIVARVELPPGVRPGGMALAWDLDLFISDRARGRLLRYGRR